MNPSIFIEVADFGLAKLVGRTNEEDVIATRLVGTPGYLPPESVKELQVTHKTDVFAFGVVLAELIAGQHALFRDNREPGKMKSLITVVFQDDHPEAALEVATDGNLIRNYPMEDIFKMAEIAEWCLSEEAVERPEMREIVVMLSQIATSLIKWEATLGGNSQQTANGTLTPKIQIQIYDYANRLRCYIRIRSRPISATADQISWQGQSRRCSS
ncbi:hypothetical protein C1H46_026489 [Malus baccata]|uniref:Protein kinase domain-containing protein n=1 Tax=Malus baccata TaxID=106549 RepID=A0A540LN56_MALBA|nr:hypothetical protein C1H46_026489 [Malus baccata]